MKPANDIRALEGKHMISILLYLNINDRCKKIEIYDNVSNNPRLPDKLDELEAMELITQFKDSDSRSMIIALTPKGKMVAQRLSELERLIRSNI